MIIKNALVLQNAEFVRADIEFEQTVLKIGKIDCDGFCADGKYIIPGLVDIHTHGAMGDDFSDADEKGFERLSKWYARHGTTAFLATTMTLPESRLVSAAECVRGFGRPRDGARCMGIHLEGPFISREKRGAHAEKYILPPDIHMTERLDRMSGGMIKMITVAPEIDGATEFIKLAAGICTVSVGHTAADYEQAVRAFECGATHLTHTYNAMPAALHRAPGPIVAAFDCGASVELICDGLHVLPPIVRMTHRLFGRRVDLISDSLRCAGMPDGEYELGGQQIILNNGAARVKGSDTIAGSAISLLDAVKNAVRFGFDPAEAVYAASTAPATAAGLCGVGVLEPGSRADLLILNDKFELEAVFIDGVKVFCTSDCKIC